MLLSSYDGCFGSLRLDLRTCRLVQHHTVGRGFTISSSMTARGLHTPTVVSKKGQPLSIAEAWPGATTGIADASGGSPVTRSAATLTASTIAGHTDTVTFSGGAAPKIDLAPPAKASTSSNLNTTDWWSG